MGPTDKMEMNPFTPRFHIAEEDVELTDFTEQLSLTHSTSTALMTDESLSPELVTAAGGELSQNMEFSSLVFSLGDSVLAGREAVLLEGKIRELERSLAQRKRGSSLLADELLNLEEKLKALKQERKVLRKTLVKQALITASCSFIQGASFVADKAKAFALTLPCLGLLLSLTDLKTAISTAIEAREKLSSISKDLLAIEKQKKELLELPNNLSRKCLNSLLSARQENLKSKQRKEAKKSLIQSALTSFSSGVALSTTIIGILELVGVSLAAVAISATGFGAIALAVITLVVGTAFLIHKHQEKIVSFALTCKKRFLEKRRAKTADLEAKIADLGFKAKTGFSQSQFVQARDIDSLLADINQRARFFRDLASYCPHIGPIDSENVYEELLKRSIS